MKLVFAIAALAVFAALAQERNAVVIESVSNVQTNFSWGKDVVTEEVGAGGRLRDRQGVLVSAADVAAEAATASNVTRVAQAYSEGFGRGTNELAAAMANLPTNGILVGLRFPLVPQTSRKFDIYVASNHYDSASNRDELYVYFGQSYTNPPTMGVPYVWDSGATTQRVAGVWTLPGTLHRWTDVYSVTERQKSGTVAYPCHRLFVARPSALRGLPLNLNPHGVWGGPEGMAFGSYLLTAGASRAAAWTGAVTNAPEGVIAVFDNGFLVELKEMEQ